MTDAVITFVDGADPLWQQDYQRALNTPPLTKRYRDWDTLRYLLRGIQECMPFVANVFLVVSRDSQVPAWCERSNLRIVRHDEIIPAEYLPTFNSTTIELFLSRISGLSERFIYFNDDIFPVAPCSEELFFPDGKPATNFSRSFFTRGYYKKHVRNSYALARKLLGLKPSLSFLRSQHCAMPMLRSACTEVLHKAESEILASLSQLRTEHNFNQSLFLSYVLLSGRGISRRLPSKFLSMATSSPEKVASAILGGRTGEAHKLICINDVRLTPERFSQYKAAIHSAFEQLFPNKSRFEN